MSGSLVVGLYAWLSAIFFGTVLLDVAYSQFLSGFPGAPEVAIVFSDVSDFLLGIGFLTVLAALGAIIISWKLPGARNWFIASLIILFVEFMAPAFLSGAVLTNGYWIRITVNAVASILAFIGLYRFYHFR